MLIVLGIIAVLALCGIIYVFFSPKSSKLQRTVALGALILSGLTVGVCGVIMILGRGEAEADPYAFPLEAAEAAPASSSPFQMVSFLIVLLIVFGLIIFLGIRGEKNPGSRKTGSGKKKESGFSLNEF